MKHPIDLPNGDLIAGELLTGVNLFSGSGLSLKGPEGTSLGFLKTVDEEEALHWRAELKKIMKAIHLKKPYSYDFALPKKVEGKVAEQGQTKK